VSGWQLIQLLSTTSSPDGVKGWMVKVDATPTGGMELDRKFLIEWPDGYRPHQVRLQGGDLLGLVLLSVKPGR